MNDFLHTLDFWLRRPLFHVGQSEVTFMGISTFIAFLIGVVIGERIFRRFVLKKLLARTNSMNPCVSASSASWVTRSLYWGFT